MTTVIVSLIIFIGVCVTILSISWLSIDIYFLSLKIENHPVLRVMVNDVLDQICKEEGLRIFNKTYDQLNADVKDDKDKSLGMYVYTLDEGHQKRVDDALCFVEDLELKYKKSYKDICILVGTTTTLEKEDFILPRILLCTDKLMTAFGANSYYSTFFHEIGHHFVAKEIGKHKEEDADRRARAIILERLPYFFQLFPYFNFRFRLNKEFYKELSVKEKLKAYYGFLKYYIKNKNTIVRHRKNEKYTEVKKIY
jgi:hypothetical protein